MGASRRTRRRKGIRDRERRFIKKGIFFSENAFCSCKNGKKMRVLRVLRVSRVLRVLRALRALSALRGLCVQWFAAVFSVVDVFESSLQIIV